MSLNDSHMLPDRVRSMRQMSDVLEVEDVVLAELERIIDEMYQRTSLLHEELINELWLEIKLEELSGGITVVQKLENELCIDISININQLSKEQEEKIIAFVNKWLPAHLAYKLSFEKTLSGCSYYTALWQDDDITILKQVGI